MTARRRLSQTQKAEIIARQDGLCSCGCGTPLAGGKVEFDHTKPLWAGGEDHPDNITAMLAACHLKKSVGEAPIRAKADSAGKKHRGEKAPSKRPLKSRGFSKAKPQRTAHQPIQKWAAWREV